MNENAPSARRKRPTQADVARHAGVSPSVVSSVLNGRQYGNIRVSQRTIERVHAAMAELGYAPNLAARGLAGGTNNLLGVFTFQRLFPLSKETSSTSSWWASRRRPRRRVSTCCC